MTPQEKAKEIYCKYADALNIRDLQITANPFAKQCALIAVDEMLDSYTNEHSYGYITSDRIIPYWQEVKQEIIKL
jgi:hypothetical protein